MSNNWLQCEKCFYWFDSDIAKNGGRIIYENYEIGICCPYCQDKIYKSILAEKEKEKKVKDLNEFIRPIWEKWAKIDIEDIKNTYCNYFIIDIMNHLDYHSFDGKTANRIVDIMEYETKNWQTYNIEDWNQKNIVVTGLKDRPHGHINILISGEYVYSGKWKKKIPLCANIGKDNIWGKGVNYAFKYEPKYYLYKLV